MKKLISVLAIAWCAGAQAQSHEFCTNIGNLAGSAMEARQRGDASMVFRVSVIKKADEMNVQSLMDEIIKEAWGTPLLDYPKAKAFKISDFNLHWYYDCMLSQVKEPAPATSE